MTKLVKPILSIIFTIMLIFNYFIFINNNNSTVTVFGESVSNINDYSDYLIDFKNTLDSKNFNQKFSILERNQYEIKKLYLDIKEIWNENLKKELREYSFDNLNNFVSYYKNKLKKYNLEEEIPNVDTSGIKINKVLIYTSKQNIEKLSQEYNLEYEKK